jgi:hypothetical protein
VLAPDGTEQKYLDLRTQVMVLYLSVITVGMILAILIFVFLTRSVPNPIRKPIRGDQTPVQR